jgi:hypothetical protein
LNAVQYCFAFAQAETAYRAAPGEWKHRTTLGAAQYRAGRYAEAAATLRDAESGSAGDAAALAFLAMAQARLGQHEAAGHALAQARERLSASRQAADGKVEALVREAEALVGQERPPPE